MDLNYILSSLLAYIIFISNIDAKPMFKLERNIEELKDISTTTQNVDVPHENSPEVQDGVKKNILQLFGSVTNENTESVETVKPEGQTILVEARNERQSQTTEEEVTRETEWTISIPRFKLDAMGKWVYNPWGVTYGRVWEDTRFNANAMVTIPRIAKDIDQEVNYYPDIQNMETVCAGKSTIYNTPKIKDWLSIHPYGSVHNSRPIMHDLRRNLFKKGNAEQCHTKDFSQFREFQECMLLRNQRLEYYIPKYPLHQLVKN